MMFMFVQHSLAKQNGLQGHFLLLALDVPNGHAHPNGTGPAKFKYWQTWKSNLGRMDVRLKRDKSRAANFGRNLIFLHQNYPGALCCQREQWNATCRQTSKTYLCSVYEFWRPLTSLFKHVKITPIVEGPGIVTKHRTRAHNVDCMYVFNQSWWSSTTSLDFFKGRYCACSELSGTSCWQCTQVLWAPTYGRDGSFMCCNHLLQGVVLLADWL